MEVQSFPGCDSSWNTHQHRLSLWILGPSSVGRDNGLSIDGIIMWRLREKHGDLPCFNTLDGARMTISGLLEALDDGASPGDETRWWTWLNSEIQQCLGKRANDIQEADLAQAAEGAAIGKRVHGEKVRMRPNLFFAIGCHVASLAVMFGSCANGRL